MEQLIEYIKPELLVLAVVLYFIGNALKKSEVKDKWIPFILGGVGIVLASIYVVATCDFNDAQSVAMGVFTAIVQGILVAGASTYVNELKKQANKVE